MAQVYATLIRKGLRTIDNIPKDLRKAVQKILDGDNEQYVTQYYLKNNTQKGGKGYGSNLRYPYCKGKKDDQ